MLKYLKKTILPLVLTCSLTIAPAVKAAVICGDSDNDGELSAADAALLLGYILNPEGSDISREVLPYLDVDASGALTSNDCALILAKVQEPQLKLPLEDVTIQTTTKTTTEATTQTTTEATTQTTTDATAETTTQMQEAPEYGIEINGVVYYIGQSESELPEPSYKGTGTESLLAYSYCEDYSHYTRIGVENGKVVSIVTFDKDAVYDSNAIGSSIDTSSVDPDSYIHTVSYKTTKKVMVELAYDSNNNDMLYSIMLTDPGYISGPNSYTEETIGEMQRQITDMTNAYRALYGLSPYAYNAKLAAVAQAHAEDMAANGYFSHDSDDGTTSAGRIENAGILYGSCGENINAGYYTAEGAMNGWISSSEHRTNLLNGARANKFTHMGVGVAYNADDYYETRFVQDFISVAK